jgi:hypothetical protein
MADKRYQVFISSTFTDLVKERAKLIEELMNASVIPAGMELFPATDDEQFEFIKAVIDDSDYLLLVLAGKYGTPAPDGISYTEKEYDYAVKQGKTVIALLHEDPSVFTDKTDVDKGAALKLAAFREKVKTGRLVKKWKTEADIVGATLSGVSHAIKVHPAVGWVRGDQAVTIDSLKEVNALQKRNKELEAEVLALRGMSPVPDLAGLDNYCHFEWRDYPPPRELQVFTWGKLFAKLAMVMGSSATRSMILINLRAMLTNGPEELTDDCMQQIESTFDAMGVISLASGAAGNRVWNLTPLGRSTLLSLTAAKKR